MGPELKVPGCKDNGTDRRERQADQPAIRSRALNPLSRPAALIATNPQPSWKTRHESTTRYRTVARRHAGSAPNGPRPRGIRKPCCWRWTSRATSCRKRSILLKIMREGSGGVAAIAADFSADGAGGMEDGGKGRPSRSGEPAPAGGVAGGNCRVAPPGPECRSRGQPGGVPAVLSR